MQRDIDLLRQLLLEIERRGATSPIDSLHADVRNDGEERVRYHLRQLTDAGLLKEAGQTASGCACVRLTYAGQEFIEFARSDARWREAKATVLAATGGMPLALVRSLLGKWACRSVDRNERRRAVLGRPRYHRYVERVEPEVWLDAYATDPDALWDGEPYGAERKRQSAWRRKRMPAAWDPDLYDEAAEELIDSPSSDPLPEHLI